jgi:hypothetical protein
LDLAAGNGFGGDVGMIVCVEVVLTAACEVSKVSAPILTLVAKFPIVAGMSALSDPPAFLDARIAELRSEIESAQRVIERATADIKVLEQAKAVLSRLEVPARPFSLGGPVASTGLLTEQQVIAELLRRPPAPMNDSAWQRVAIALLRDMQPHSTADVFAKVEKQFGSAVKYSAVASWLIRAEKAGKLAKHGRGKFRLLSQEESALRNANAHMPVVGTHAPVAANAEPRLAAEKLVLTGESEAPSDDEDALEDADEEPSPERAALEGFRRAMVKKEP